jgi:acetylglutamate kinase
MIDLLRAAPHVRMHHDSTMVIKVGGGSLTRRSQLLAFARQIAAIHTLGSRVVIVHGGGPQTDDLQRLLGEEPRKVDGRRVTSEAAMRALIMATAGELNGSVSAAVTSAGAPAVGMCAADAGLLVAVPRQPSVTSEGVVAFGSVEVRPLLSLLSGGFVPVVSPPAGDGRGGFLNVNADIAAAEIAIALGASKLVLTTGTPGILRQPDDESSLVSALTLAGLHEFAASGSFENGMRVKATAIQRALEGGVRRVHVVSGSDPEAILRELYTTPGAGTLITLEAEEVPVALPVDGAPA